MTQLNESMLSEYDFKLVIDRSGSMGETDCPGGKSRWDFMRENAMSFARDMAKLDSDGIDVVTFGGVDIKTFSNVTAGGISDIFTGQSPRGGTPLAQALTAAINLGNHSDKKQFIMVFTDGLPDDQEAAAKVIRDQSNKQVNDEDLTFLFIQVGYDKSATQYLSNLDDHLTGCKFDIVDALTIEEAEKFSSTVDMVIKAIND
jgi:Mg-chelatase subunit ChlD